MRWRPSASLASCTPPPGNADGKSESQVYGLVIFWNPNDNEIDNRYNLKNERNTPNSYPTTDGKPLHIDLGVKLLATQLPYEEDSFGPDYDADAWYELQQDDSGAYLLYSAGDLMAFNAKMNEPGFIGEGNPISTYVKLMADIDMSGYDWLSINEMFVSFDGNGHTISNLNCIENGNKSGFFAYLGGGIIKNLTLENVTSVGSQAGIFAGQSEGGTISNCNVAGTNYVAWDDDSGDRVTKNGIGVYVGVSVDAKEISGTIKKGAEITLNSNGMTGGWDVVDKYAGGLYNQPKLIDVVDENEEGAITVIEGAISSGRIEYAGDRYQIAADFAATGVKTLEVEILDQNGNMLTTITPEGYQIPDNGNIGDPTDKTQNSWNTACAAITGNSSSWKHTPFVPTLEAVPTKMVLVVNGLELAECGISENSYPNGRAWSEVVGETIENVATVADLHTALSEGKVVIMENSITAEAAQSSGYGKAGVVVSNSAVLDGNGETLTINKANGTWDCAVNLTGGMVKNLTIKGGFRGIFVSKATGDIVIDNCVIEDVVYTFNSDAGSKECSVTIKNTVLNGWTSFSDVHKSVDFIDCKFGEGSGYAFCRPYNDATFTNCVFAEGFEFDATRADTLTFVNCYYGDTLITAENAATLSSGGVAFFSGNNIGGSIFK